ncbi:MAG: peptide chain release factor N(5)-glutamine methyltransferase [Clostridia bacterium]|nr:peptide chain release factor N(5)-glutamine methyltransferase [Clostridia bacterium]
MPTIRETLRDAARRLEAAGVPDARDDAALLLSHVTGEPQLNLRADPERPVSPVALAAYEALVSRRARREPLQYITGEAWFMGLCLKTAPGVLIPRFDTETLCQQAMERMNGAERVLDLCTGSGALAVAIAGTFPQARVLAGDISDTAARLARENAARCGADVEVRLGDLFAPFAGERFDIIVSNPPYIPAGALKSLQEEVRREPALALDGGPDGLDFYRRIIKEAPGYLVPGGWLLLEIGSDQGAAVCGLMAKDYREIERYSDLNGLSRVVAGRIRDGVYTDHAAEDRP